MNNGGVNWSQCRWGCKFIVMLSDKSTKLKNERKKERTSNRVTGTEELFNKKLDLNVQTFSYEQSQKIDHSVRLNNHNREELLKNFWSNFRI